MTTIECSKCKTTFKFISLLKRHLNISSRCKTSDEEITKISNEINTIILNNKHDKLINKTNICNYCKYIFLTNFC